MLFVVVLTVSVLCEGTKEFCLRPDRWWQKGGEMWIRTARHLRTA